MGEESVADYCRQIEAYLCQKNDGHLIRVVGPSFERVSAWAGQGIPIKVAFKGIDRYFERYYRSGPRRRPVRIDFCEDDVLDVFDEWRRATGVVQRAPGDSEPVDVPAEPRQSLPKHLERVLTRLSTLRATDAIGVEFDRIIDGVAAELERVRGASGGIRGAAREAALARLAALDADLLTAARAALRHDALDAIARDAEQELAPFRQTMPPDAYERGVERVVDRLLREQFGFPSIAFP